MLILKITTFDKSHLEKKIYDRTCNSALAWFCDDEYILAF